MPRVGEAVRLSNGAQTPSLIVEHVLWMEGDHAKDDDPTVILVVRPHLGPERR